VSGFGCGGGELDPREEKDSSSQAIVLFGNVNNEMTRESSSLGLK
jgi:hypothetical protein